MTMEQPPIDPPPQPETVQSPPAPAEAPAEQPPGTEPMTPGKGVMKNVRVTEAEAQRIEDMIDYAFGIDAIPEPTYTAFAFFAFDCAFTTLLGRMQKRRGFS